jgi:hypothetical protein
MSRAMHRGGQLVSGADVAHFLPEEFFDWSHARDTEWHRRKPRVPSLLEPGKPG